MAQRAAKRRSSQNTRDEATRNKRNDRRQRKHTKPSSANTAAFHYFDRSNMAAACRADKKRIRDTCDDKPENIEESKKSVDKARLDPKTTNGTTRGLTSTLKKGITAIDGAGKLKSGYKPTAKNKWMDDHCSGLWHKPGGGTGEGATRKSNTDAFKEQIQDKVNELTQVAENVQAEFQKKLLNFADDYMKSHASEILNAAKEKAAKRALLMRAPALASVLSRLSFWESMGHLIGNVAGAIMTNDMATKFDAIAKSVNDAVEKVGEYKRLLGAGLEDAMASTMAALAIANPCMKARKCLLVPYEETGKTDGSGCCPGQTGHHLLPNAMFDQFAPVAAGDNKTKIENTGKKRPCWEGYKKDKALTICLEGTSNRAANGSHGAVHSGTAKILDEHRNSLDMPYPVARDKIAVLLSKMYGCNSACIKAQLDDSLEDKYKKSCGSLADAKVTPHSGHGSGGPTTTGPVFE